MAGYSAAATDGNYIEPIDYIHPGLKTLDYTRVDIKVTILLISVVIFAIIYAISAIIASLTWTYCNLRIKEKIFWNLAVVRAVFGVFGGAIGAWAVFASTPLEADPVFATTPTSHFAVCVTTGFFIFECTALLLSDLYFRKMNLLLNIHHWLSLCGFASTLFIESSHFFAVKGLILEMSTPFSALCWTLLKCGQERTLLWRANQFLLVHTFHCRSVVECYLWWATYQNWPRIWSAMPMAIFIQLYLELAAVTFIMTPYWTYKKTAQMVNPIDWNFEDSNANKATNGSIKKTA